MHMGPKKKLKPKNNKNNDNKTILISAHSLLLIYSNITRGLFSELASGGS